jgi:hypothetical protein
MATNSTMPSLPNPFTPLAFMPPDLAEQFQAEIYITIAALSVSLYAGHTFCGSLAESGDFP